MRPHKHFPVDTLSEGLVEVQTRKLIDAEIYELTSFDMPEITSDNGWLFDWQKELLAGDRKAYKIIVKNNPVIQGLISIEDRKTFLFLPLIETAPHNLGQKKQYKNAPKNLIAFACKRSFESGYDREVAFRPKTKLIAHYKKELEAELLPGGQMFISSENAHKLVSLCYKNFKL